ncbi:MAG: SGNH/GDSL hydrolase family protein [Candidatus Hydrogenedentes bacterium]|nr:SGNH/GDSL hydrolase family protein [Candidatus Hydrogenedentota bacterium]
MRKSIAREILLLTIVLVPITAMNCATAGPEATPVIGPLDASKGVPGSDGKVVWFNALDLGVEGQAWNQVKHPYDRFPAEAENVVPKGAWRLSEHSAGLCVRFVSDSPEIWARWTLRFDELAMNHMPATGVSGLDLYAKGDGGWGWVAVGRPKSVKGNEAKLIASAPPGLHEYVLYLPLYNAPESVEIGVNPGTTLAKASPYACDRAKPMLFWGTSILQGGCASRPGMAYPAIIGRRMQRPTINLGFSGAGKMDPEVTELIAQLDVSVYVVDCSPNMKTEMIIERTEPMVHALRKARPATPIVLVENVPYEQGWFLESSRKSYQEKNAALRAAYERLRQEGVKHLYYVPCEGLFGDDHEATVDGTHATDLGFLRMADVIEPVLRRILE